MKYNKSLFKKENPKPNNHSSRVKCVVVPLILYFTFCMQSFVLFGNHYVVMEVSRNTLSAELSFYKEIFRNKWVVARDYYIKHISIHRVSPIFSGTTKVFIIKLCVE